MKPSLILLTFCFFIQFLSFNTVAQSPPDWSEDARLGSGKWAEFDRGNLFDEAEVDFQKRVVRGKVHAIQYPVSVSGALFPMKAWNKVFFSLNDKKSWWDRIIGRVAPFQSAEDFYQWAGFLPFPENDSQNYSNIPAHAQRFKDLPMAATVIERFGTKGITFGCASCHSSDLFGKKVLGMTNRFPRANEVFIMGKKALNLIPTNWALRYLGLEAGDAELYQQLGDNLKWVAAKKPQALGLDTSLAQVGISLHKRKKDAWASKERSGIRLRKHPLESRPADSKPAVWWNLKYKTRWLSDGSLVSGNPVYTNFLWNEIGRGVDLKDLEGWLKNNQQTVDDLTAAVFATQAPRYEDFFDLSRFDLASAKRGQQLFLNNCKGCHGVYDKAWDSEQAEQLSLAEKIQTTKVHYHSKTKVKDVGTDPYRYKGMSTFSDDLNRLAISQFMQTKVVPQKGYVPPPLVGIWARWPYFHNNSVPTLCDVLTVSWKRPKVYYARPANDPEKDFDQECNGYPRTKNSGFGPLWRPLPKKYRFDTSLKGLSNGGHTRKILLDRNGRRKFDRQDLLDLVMFLKTL
jgi:mono/diheme cytochrome c family protein